MCSLMASINSSPQLLGQPELEMGASSSPSRLSWKSPSPLLPHRRESQHRASQAAYNLSTPEMTAAEFSDSEASTYSSPDGYRNSKERSPITSHKTSPISFPHEIPYKPRGSPDDHGPRAKRSRFTPELQIPESLPESPGYLYQDRSPSPHTLLPPPAIPEFPFQPLPPFTDLDTLSKSIGTSEEPEQKSRPIISKEERAAWEKKLFTNSAVLCDL